jgi:aminobenzoyl-glutamate utilization protein B
MYNNLKQVGGVIYNERETEFGKKLQESFITPEKPPLANAAKIDSFRVEGRGGGSTDVGDVSWVVPTVGLRIATWIPGTPAHSWQAVACGGTEIGTKGMMVAAKTLALTGLDLFTNPKLIEEAKAEWKKARGENFVYKALLGDRKPALDYRD